MPARGTRGAYRKEDRVQLPAELQKELVEKAAARYGNCQELAKHLNMPKSSVHYYRIGRLTMPVSVLEEMLRIANDDALRVKIESRGITKDRSWATEYAQDIFREMCREKVRLPTRFDLENNQEIRRKAAAIVSYLLAEGSIWLQKEQFGEHAVNITLADHETDLYEHFRTLCRDVFKYDIGPPQMPGNGARAIRGFVYSRFVAEWLAENGVKPGEKSAKEMHLPRWVMDSEDQGTWIAALQPWCDGEGGIMKSNPSARPSFSISQSRHTNLDVNVIPMEIISANDRGIGLSVLRELQSCGIRVLDHCSSECRSEVLDEVMNLFIRLGFTPKMCISRLHLKHDGFWSCIWQLRFCCDDSQRLVECGIITQKRKLDAFQKHDI
jgi:hypothetical protein